ncbi:MAG TPA: hypothetical protein VIT66_01590, partial [Lysobacter sp.]
MRWNAPSSCGIIPASSALPQAIRPGSARPGSGVPMQYIYTMNGVSKVVPPKRQIIKDISLSF